MNQTDVRYRQYCAVLLAGAVIVVVLLLLLVSGSLSGTAFPWTAAPVGLITCGCALPLARAAHDRRGDR